MILAIAGTFVLGTLASGNLVTAENITGRVIDNQKTILEEAQALNGITRAALFSLDTDFDKIVCTSDADFLVHVLVEATPGSSYTWNSSVTSGFVQGLATETRMDSYTIGALANEEVSIDASTSPQAIIGMLTMQTAKNAQASCTDQ